ncbi:MAG TPA: OsmC family protein [Telluria sp.]
MLISAVLRNAGAMHDVTLSTDGASHSLGVAAKGNGQGSSFNGGEFLLLAIATCYCNDLYREAARLGMSVTSVEVRASAEFDGRGLAARDIRYAARVESPASEEQVQRLIRETDAVAEVHNTLRSGAAVTRVPWSAPPE